MQAQPVLQLSICEELDAELRGLTAGTSFQVLDVVAKHIAPLALLRRTVERWHDSLPQHHTLKEAAEDVKLTLYPEYIAEVVQPFSKRVSVWIDEAPVLEPLCAMGFVCSGELAQYQISEPVCPSPVFPWEGFGTLREAHARVLWTLEALAICRAAVLDASSCPVRVSLGPKAQSALPLACRWFRELGFSFRSNCFTLN